MDASDHYVVDEKHYAIDDTIESSNNVVITTPPEFWNEAEEYWESFRREWWGCPDKIRELHDKQSHILTVSPELASHELSCMAYTGGRIYVRQETCDMYDEICAIYDGGENQGVMFTGQPGCGKSCSLVYFIIRRLARKQTTFFTTSSGSTLLFTECGTFLEESRDIRSNHMEWATLRIWSLIDWIRAEEPPNKLTMTVFPIQASSPDRNRYKSWVKELQAVILYMSPWTTTDLVQALKLDVRSRNEEVVARLSESLEVAAPCPRDVLGYHYDFGFLAAQDNELYTLLLADIKSIFVGSPVASDRFFDRIALILVTKGHRGFLIDFASPKVEREVLKQIRTLSLDSAVELYSKCSPVPSAVIFTSWIFEAIMINVTRSKNGRLKDFYKMQSYENARFAFDGRGNNPGTIVQQFGVQSKRDVNNRGNYIIKLMPSPPSALPVGIKELVVYNDISEVTFDPHKYYVPSKRNNPLFDAFFYQVVEQDRRVRLWIVQATTGKTHGGAEAGYTMIKELVKRVPAHTVERIYVLAVPLERMGNLPRVIWDMPDGWNEAVDGEVFVQFIDVRVLRE